MGATRDIVRSFSDDVKYQVGTALRQAQSGGKHDLAKPLKGFGGASVLEIRADDPDGTYRVVYTVQFREYVFVLHAFQKKSRQGITTPLNEIRLVQSRLADARNEYEMIKKEGRRP